ncbi:uncharacterized protein LOC129900520 [Solanum dulcamara]|uniref:uncharacterized protein LOC129900520 n=1 Tax=Solanum dulcamara TaxID=45834 RepID=UPI0024857E20|nr:uncharacterized protein LOC129900520 [Solanum dulcamara]
MSSASSLEKFPCKFGDCGSSKKKFKFDLDSSLDEKYYNARAFIIMGYSHTESSWVIKNEVDDPVGESLKGKLSSSTFVSSEKLNAALEKIVDMDVKLEALTISVTQLSDILTRIIDIDEKFDNFKDKAYD